MVSAQNARLILSTFLLGGSILLAPAAASAQTLEKIKARGNVACGVNPSLLGFSARDAQGNWSGFDIDLCRALAAAIFNDPGKVVFTPLGTAERLQALQADKIDVLSRNTTWTFSREAALKLNFAAVTYYDGQGFLVRRGKNATSALELDGATVCVQKGTTSELNLADYFRTNNMKYQLVALPDADRGGQGLRRGQVHGPHQRYVATLCGTAAAEGSRRSHRVAGYHLQGAARPVCALGRRPVAQHREVDALSR